MNEIVKEEEDIDELYKATSSRPKRKRKMTEKLKAHVKEEIEEEDEEDVVAGFDHRYYRGIQPGISVHQPPTTIHENIKLGGRRQRGRFQILDVFDQVRPAEAIFDLNLDVKYIDDIFADYCTGVQFLARYGLILNTRYCRVPGCVLDKPMSLIRNNTSHSVNFVWRCRSCRKGELQKTITKVSIFEDSFLFYSRIGHNKLFLFLHAWATFPGASPNELNRILRTQKMVDETISNTVGFIRDHIQLWVEKRASASGKIGARGRYVELIYTPYTVSLGGRQRNRKERTYSSELFLICYETNECRLVDMTDVVFDLEVLVSTLDRFVNDGAVVLVKDSLLLRMGSVDTITEVVMELTKNRITFATIADAWRSFDKAEKDRQGIKTDLERPNIPPYESTSFEYYFRRLYDKPLNGILYVLRLLYESPDPPRFYRRAGDVPSSTDWLPDDSALEAKAKRHMNSDEIVQQFLSSQESDQEEKPVVDHSKH